MWTLLFTYCNYNYVPETQKEKEEHEDPKSENTRAYLLFTEASPRSNSTIQKGHFIEFTKSP